MNRVAFLIISMLILTARADACIWDYDTLRDERRGLPGVAEALAGRFEKRSEAFYIDRVARMETHLATNPDDEDAIDNYAVALFRIGKADRAIEVMLDKERRFPDRYTTSSNLATFYMLHSDSASAIPLLEKAMKINPNAHFGREEYQLKLAESIVASTTQPSNPALKDFLGIPGFERRDEKSDEYTVIHPRALGGHVTMTSVRMDKAMTALLGMIRFGTENSPDLYYALGNQLTLRGDRRLAVRAYLRAIETGHPQADKVRMLAEEVATIIHPEQSLEDITAEFKKERQEAEVWVKAYQDWSMQLIQDGKNPDDEINYAAFYARFGPATPEIGYSVNDYWNEFFKRGSTAQLVVIPIAAFVLLVGMFLVRDRLRKRRSRPKKA